jgi:hypothetical protein
MDGELEASDVTATEHQPAPLRRLFRRVTGHRPHPKWFLRLLVPFGLFGSVLDFRVLNPLSAARMMSSIDWTTYIVSPNYLRSSPLLSMPIGQIPKYVAPIGTALAHTDTVPLLTPIYRLLIAIYPDRPIQLLGLILILGWVGTFVSIAWFLDKVRIEMHPVLREATILCFASIATIAPFWTVQYGHPSLMQGWIIVLALGGAARRCPTAFGGAIEQTDRRWTGIGPVCAAAAIQPYFLPMVFVVVIAPDLARIGVDRTWWLKKAATAMGLAVVIDYVLGYIGGGGSLGSPGFGIYASDLIALVDPNGQSRYVRDLPSLLPNYEGYAWTGVGGICLLAIGLVVHRRRSVRSAPVDVGSTIATRDRLPFRFLCGAVALNAIYAWMPQVRFARHVVVDLRGITRHISSITALFRVNGRFILVLVWMLLLAAMVTIVRLKRPTVVFAIAAIALVVQVSDVRPWPGLIRADGSVHYTDAVRELRTELASGRNTIEVQPPVLVPFCYDQKTFTFDRLGDILLAASVLGIPSSSGYLSREDPVATATICTDQRNAFDAGTYSAHTIYVMAESAAPPAALTCRPLTPGLIVCDYTPA